MKKHKTDPAKRLLNKILLEAKANINDGKLYDHDGDICAGICAFVEFHRSVTQNTPGGKLVVQLCSDLYQASPFYKNGLYVAMAGDFAHPKRLALLNWLIEQTS